MEWVARVAVALGVAACGGSEMVEFPGDDVAPRWVVAGSGESDATAVAVLPDGDVIVLVRVTATVSSVAQLAIGGESFAFGVNEGLVLLKLSGYDGSIVASFELDGSFFGGGIVVEPGGDIFITAAHADAVDLGGGPLPEPGHFVARFSGDDLSHVWSRSMDVVANISGFRLALDGSGDVLAALDSSARLYVEKLSGSDGATLWTAAPLAGDSAATDVAVLPDGGVAVVGLVNNGSSLSPVVISLAGDDGATVWSRTFDVTGNGATADQVQPLDDGGILVAGSVYGSVDLDGTAAEGTYRPFAARLSAAGEVEWARDLCEDDFCYSAPPLGVHLQGGLIAGPIPRGPYDLDIALRSLSSEDAALGAATALSSSTGDVLGDLATDDEGRTFLVGRTGWVIHPDQPDQYGSVFVVAL